MEGKQQDEVGVFESQVALFRLGVLLFVSNNRSLMTSQPEEVQAEKYLSTPHEQECYLTLKFYGLP